MNETPSGNVERGTRTFPEFQTQEHCDVLRVPPIDNIEPQFVACVGAPQVLAWRRGDVGSQLHNGNGRGLTSRAHDAMPRTPIAAAIPAVAVSRMGEVAVASAR